MQRIPRDQPNLMDADSSSSEALITFNNCLLNCHLPKRSSTLSEFSYDTNSTSNSSTDTSKKNESTKSRKNRIIEMKPMINQIKVHIPSVPKLDIRLHYFKMFLNILNGQNLLLLRRFLDQYCRSDCSLEHRFEVVHIISAPGLADVVGIQTMYEYWRGYMLVMPDGIVHLKDFDIFVSSDHKSSRIIADVIVKGTKLFEIPVEKWMPSYNDGTAPSEFNGSEIKNKNIENKLEILPSTTSEISELKTLDRELQADRPMTISRRIGLELHGSIILELDRNKFIRKFVLEEKADLHNKYLMH